MAGGGDGGGGRGGACDACAPALDDALLAPPAGRGGVGEALAPRLWHVLRALLGAFASSAASDADCAADGAAARLPEALLLIVAEAVLEEVRIPNDRFLPCSRALEGLLRCGSHTRTHATSS